jgi:hypothetical protein
MIEGENKDLDSPNAAWLVICARGVSELDEPVLMISPVKPTPGYQ